MPSEKLKQATLPIFVLLLSMIVGYLIFSNPPKGRKAPVRAPAVVPIEVEYLKQTDFQIIVNSYGVTQPKMKSQLVSQVSGKVLFVSEMLRNGSFFKKDDVLLKVEPRDYEIEVSVAEAAVADANVQLEQESAQAEFAEKDWNIKPSNERARALALREPQIKAAQAALKSALAKLEKAKMAYSRTIIRAPYDGRVLNKFVDLGDVVSASTPIADVYSTDVFEVRLPIKNKDLEYLHIPVGNVQNLGQTLDVTFEAQIGLSNYLWQGRIIRSEASIDADSRQLYLIAEIESPTSQANNERPTLNIGQFLNAKIQGELLNQVFVIPQQSVTQNNRLGVITENKIKKVSINPLWSNGEYIVFKDDLKSGTEYSRTPVNNLPNGTRVRTIDIGENDKNNGAIKEKDYSNNNQPSDQSAN